MVKKYLYLALMGLASGICIAIGGTVYLSVVETSKVLGALFFCIGLFIIICYSFALFTGRVGYVFEKKWTYILDLVIMWFSNLLGTAIVALLFRQTRLFDAAFEARTVALVASKASESWYGILILAIFCGMLVHLAVHTQKLEKLHPVFKIVAIFGCISVFILCGFEHVIADMYYVTLANAWSLKWIGYILLITLGNSIGAWIIWGFDKIATKIKDLESKN